MCTSVKFTDSSNNLYFGRNLDWETPFGQSVFATQRNFKHPKYMDGDIATKYACLGVGIVVDGFPLYFDLGNEKGLACAGLNFPGFAKYEDKDVEGKTNIPSYAFPFYIATQFASVDEAEEALKDIAITSTPFNDKTPAAGLHWIIGDSKRTIVVEYMEDGMHVYDNKLDVLANQPTFPYHVENARNYISLTPDYPKPVDWREDTLLPFGSGSGMRGMPGDFYSPSRFIRAAYFNAHYPEQTGEEANVNRLFKTLQGSAMILGGAEMESGKFEYTTYTSCFSASKMNYYYATYENPTIYRFEMPKSGLDDGNVIKIEASN